MSTNSMGVMELGGLPRPLEARRASDRQDYAPPVALPTRDQAIDVLDEGRSAIGELYGGLTEDQAARPATIGGGDWSAKDLVAHLETWEAIALKTIEEWRDGVVPSIEEAFAKGPEAIDALNAEWYEAKLALTPSEVETQAAQTHRDLVEEIRHMDDAEWASKAFYETDRRQRLGQLLAAILGAPKRPFGHAFAHIPDLRAYVESVAAG